MRDLELL
jgi:hypothetical protein